MDDNLLRTRDFRLLWLGDAPARLGYQIAQFLLPLLAVAVLGSTAAEVGLVSAALSAPVLVLSLVAGVLADRVPTRALLVACNLVRGAALGVLGLVHAVAGVDLWLLVSIAVLVGCATVVYDIGYQTVLPRVVPIRQLTSGNGVLLASISVAQMAGPALAGFFVQETGLPIAAAATAALFAGALVSFAMLRVPTTGQRGANRARPSVTVGARFVWQCRPIRSLCVQSGLFNLHEQAFLTAFTIYGVRTAGLSGGTVGLVIGAGSAGALVGSLATGRLSARLHAGRVVTTSLVIGSMALAIGVLLSGHGHQVPILAAAFALNGIALAAYNVFAVSLRQTLSPPELLGSVAAVYRLATFGPISVGAVVGGGLVGLIDARTALLAIACSAVCFTALLLPSPLRYVRSVEQAGASQAAQDRDWAAV